MRFLLSALIAMLVIPANAQSLWRNFFTTNQNPIVDVVAGSNATVQASTVGSNLRRFTVNSTGSGTPQTNISYVAVTNAPWQQGSANLTNWGSISTNESAFLANNQVFTGSNYFTQPLTLSLATNTPSAGQVLTATSAGSAEWKPLAAAGSASFQFAGAIYNDIGTTERFCPINGGDVSGNEEFKSIAVPNSILLTNLYYKASYPYIPVGTNVTVTIYTNGVASELRLVLMGTGSSATTNCINKSALISAGGTISIGIKGGFSPAQTTYQTWSVQAINQ